MGLISAQKVVTRAEYYGRRSILQPGNREWVTTIEAICADGYSLPPCVIYNWVCRLKSTTAFMAFSVVSVVRNYLCLDFQPATVFP